MAHTKITYHHDDSGKITYVTIERYQNGRNETTAAIGTTELLRSLPFNIDAQTCPDKYGHASKQ